MIETVAILESPTPFRAIVIEDDEKLRATVISTLEKAGFISVTGEAGDYRSAGALIDGGDFDIALVDLNLRGKYSFELVRRIARQSDAQAVVVSFHGDQENVLRAIEAGASGYLLKEDGLADLPGLLARVRNGESPLSPAVAKHLLRKLRGETGGPGCEDGFLSRREREVLTELARGATYQEAADAIGISVNTLGDYIKSLYRKLQVTSRGEAVHKAMRAGILSP